MARIDILTGLLRPSVEGGGSSSGGGGSSAPSGLSTVTVTEYSPAKSACSGLSKVVVSGLGIIGEEADYSSANGTYLVTEDTERIAKPFERIYRHTSGEWYIWGEYDPEYEEGYWYIGPAPDSGNLVYWTTENLSSGTVTFEDWEWGGSAEVTLDVTATDYPDTPVVLNGVTDSGSSVSLTGYDAAPEVGRKYLSDGTSLIGRALDAGNGVMPYKLAVLTHWGYPSYRSGRFIDESGNDCELIQQSSTDLYTETSQANSLFGNPILYFNYLRANEGHVVIKKVPKTYEFTIDYWECLISDDNTKWGGTVLVNKTCYDASGEWDDSTLISANKGVTNKISKQWFHHAFVFGGSLATDVIEYINGVEVARQTWQGDVFYNENTGNVDYNNERSIFGDDEYAFCPGGIAGSSSSKYVAQLAIWGRALSESELAAIAQHKQPYYL